MTQRKSHLPTHTHKQASTHTLITYITENVTFQDTQNITALWIPVQQDKYLFLYDELQKNISRLNYNHKRLIKGL